MLARAFAYASPYAPHPLRRRLSQRAGVALPSPPTALGELKQELSKHRDLLYPTTPKEADLKLDAGKLTFASMSRPSFPARRK
jgi:hypothetical protein